MPDSHDPHLDRSLIKARHSDPTTCAEIESWHIFTANTIQCEIARRWNLLELRTDCVISNAGTGSTNLDFAAR